MAFSAKFKELLWMFAICSSLAGVQFCYSIQFSIGTPLFTDALKMTSSMSSVILATAGPVSGFLVQPLIGAWSDKSRSKFGRRRPFILVGSICCALGMALLGFSNDLGILLGDKKNGPSSSDHVIGTIFAITGMFVMNIFVNVIQGPARAVVSDILREDQQHQGNSIVSGVMGLSAIVANVVGAQFFMLPDPYRNLFIIGVVCIILTAIPTIICAKEIPYVPQPGEKEISVKEVFYNIYKGFRYMPKKMYLVVAVLFLSWCGYSPYMIYATQFFGNNIYHGVAEDDILKDDYYDGVMAGMYALAIFSAVQWMYSFILPHAIKKTSVPLAYGVSQVLATACYFVFNFYPNVYLTTGLMALIAINFTTMNSVPYALIKGITNGGDAGLYMGVLNASTVVSQTFSETIAGQLLNVFPKLTIESDGNGSDSAIASYTIQNVGWGIFVGGIFSVIASIVSFFLKEETKDAEYKKLLNDSDEAEEAVFTSQDGAVQDTK